jgi:hypothetical protein
VNECKIIQLWENTLVDLTLVIKSGGEGMGSALKSLLKMKQLQTFRFRELTMSESHWSEISPSEVRVIDLSEQRCPSINASHIASAFPHAYSLSLPRPLHLTNLIDLPELLPKLRVLKVVDTSGASPIWTQLTALSGLKELEIGSIHQIPAGWEPSSLTSLTAHWPPTEELGWFSWGIGRMGIGHTFIWNHPFHQLVSLTLSISRARDLRMTDALTLLRNLSLHIGSNEENAREGLRHTMSLPLLTSFRLTHSEYAKDTHVRLQDMPLLQSVVLIRGDCEFAGVFPAMQHFRIARGLWTGNLHEALPNLTSLVTSSGMPHTFGGDGAIQQLTLLTSLVLERLLPRPFEIEHLTSLPRLKHLRLNGEDRRFNYTLQHLSALTQLTSLHIIPNRPTTYNLLATQLQALTALTNLRYFRLGGILDLASHWLKFLRQWESLDIVIIDRGTLQYDHVEDLAGLNVFRDREMAMQITYSYQAPSFILKLDGE